MWDIGRQLLYTVRCTYGVQFSIDVDMTHEKDRFIRAFLLDFECSRPRNIHVDDAVDYCGGVDYFASTALRSQS